ncbi:MAG: NAD(P)-dependent oxidoreductase, partial [Patescibacteria group bacterium]
YIDHTYCAKRHIPITNVPHYSRESVAEHVFALLLGAAKRVITTDRKTQQNQYGLTVGTEIKGKTLGVIGYGSIGSRVAEIGNAFGMRVIAYNRSPKKARGVTFTSLTTLLKKSDAISINLSHSEKTLNFLSAKRIKQLKNGVIIINTADNTLVDEHAIARALNAGKIDSYVAEVDDVNAKPLCTAKNAFLLKGFGWYTTEALSRNKDIWIDNIKSLINGKPLNAIK